MCCCLGLKQEADLSCPSSGKVKNGATYCCMCLHSINRDSFFSPRSAVWRCRLTPSTDTDKFLKLWIPVIITKEFNHDFCFEFFLFPLPPIQVTDYEEESSSTPREVGTSSLASQDILHILWDLESLPCSQEPITSPCPEPDYFSPQHQTLFLQDPF